MTDGEAVIVQEHVAAFLRSKEGRGLDIGDPSHLELLVNHARPDLTGVAEDELRVVVTMCWLGPPAAGIPPQTLREELFTLLRQCAPNERERLDRVMEFTLAYGCGKWRQVQSGYGTWAQRWQGAMRGLVRVLEPAAAQANRWLAAHVAGFPQDRDLAKNKDFPEDTAIWSDAWMLAIRLVHPEHAWRIENEETLTIACLSEGVECTVSAHDSQLLIPPGAKALWTLEGEDTVVILPHSQSVTLPTGGTVLLIARDDDVIIRIFAGQHGQQMHLKVKEEAEIAGPLMLALWECTCGTTHCRMRHRLETWDPMQMVQKAVTEDGYGRKEASPLTLWDFVASAVKGPQPRIQTGSFVQGAYFPLLAQEGCDQ